jgi:hypothetical protein
MGAYNEHRRIEPVRRLAAVTKDEAMEMTDVDRERRLEKGWEALAVELARAEKRPRRSFGELIKKR